MQIQTTGRMDLQTIKLEDFLLKSFDKLRYADTDRQGHVNNAAFSTFLETGRVEILYNGENKILSNNASFVIASLKLNFRDEINWPGIVETGTCILKIGNSSISLFQKIYQHGNCVAEAETVVVQLDNTTKKSLKLSDEARVQLEKYLIS